MAKQVLVGEEERKLEVNSLITTLKTIDKEYKISFDCKYSDLLTCGNILYFTSGDDTCCILAVYKNCKDNDIFLIKNAPSNELQHQEKIHVAKDDWHTFVIAQKQVGDDYYYSITVDGKEIQRVMNTNPKTFNNVKVYACSPWSIKVAIPAHIRNLSVWSGRQIDPELMCTICKEILKQPKMLHCTHTFCQMCIQTLDNVGVIICPICMFETRNDSTEKVLPNNRVILKKIEKRLREWNGENILLCNECEIDKAIQYCCDCKLKLCNVCSPSHKRCVRTIGHKVVNIEDIPEEALYEPQVSMCVKHKMHTKYYCKECKTAICIDCTHSKVHQGHAFSLMDEVVEEETEILKDVIADCRVKCEVYEKVYLKGVEEFIISAKEKTVKSVKIVEETFNSLISILQTQKDRELQWLDETCDSSEASLKNAREAITVLRANASYLEELMSLPQGEVAEEVLERSIYLKKSIKGITDAIEKKTQDPECIFHVNASVREIAGLDFDLDDIETSLEEINFVKHNYCQDDIGNF